MFNFFLFKYNIFFNFDRQPDGVTVTYESSINSFFKKFIDQFIFFCF